MDNVVGWTVEVEGRQGVVQVDVAERAMRMERMREMTSGDNVAVPMTNQTDAAVRLVRRVNTPHAETARGGSRSARATMNAYG